MTIAFNCRNDDIHDAMEMQPPVQNHTVAENPAAKDEGLPENELSNPLYHTVQVFNNKGNVLIP